MRNFIKHTLRFIFFVVAQTLVFNKFEPGLGIHPMIYPLFIFLLPFEFGIITMLFLAFAMGICIDALSETYGLHTSALVLLAYLRPLIFKAFSPRDGYDPLKEGTIFEMGTRWFVLAFGSLLLLHHFWFFAVELFKLNEIGYLLMKLLLSLPISFIFCVLFQYIFLKRESLK